MGWIQIVMIISGVAVARSLIAVLKTRKHLDEGELRRYINGGRFYTDDQRQRVTQHLGVCKSCRLRFDELLFERNVAKD